MAFTELELKRCERALEKFLAARRPPAHLRDEVDLTYRIAGHSVEIFEIRPDWKDRSQKHESAVAKTTFVRTQKRWRVYWQRRDLKWHGYDPPEVRTFEEFLAIVEEDEYGCFFG